MSEYIKKLERDYSSNKISLTQLTIKRDEYYELSDQEKEKLDYPQGKPKDETSTIISKEVLTEDEKATTIITGNETMNELVVKVNKCDSLEEKMGVCMLIIASIELRNSVMPGGFKHDIALSKKYPPTDPTKPTRFMPRIAQLNDFLFYLKDTEHECYEILVDSHKEPSDK